MLVGEVGADDRVAGRQAAVGGHGGDVPLNLGAVAESAHECGEAAVVRVDCEPARGAVAVGAERVSYAGRRCEEAAGGDCDRFGLAPDLEDQLAVEDVERVGVLVMDVRAGYLLAGRVARVGDRYLLACEEDAALARGVKWRWSAAALCMLETSERSISGGVLLLDSVEDGVHPGRSIAPS